METRQSVAPPPEVSRRLQLALGQAPVAWFTPHTGLSRAQRYIVHFGDGSSAFVKAATNDATEAELRTEQALLECITEDFVPRQRAWITDQRRPILILEDLSQAHWPADHSPVEWRPGQLDLLLRTLPRIARTACSVELPRAETGFQPAWPAIASHSAAFLGLSLCSEEWLRRTIDQLSAAELAVTLAGDGLVHNDVRSDNLCFPGHRVVLVDWGSAVRGNPLLDLTALLTTLPLEGGPDPFTLLPEAGPWAAYHAGRLAWRAVNSSGDPDWLRRVIKRRAAIGLLWAAQSLVLTPYDGPKWEDIP